MKKFKLAILILGVNPFILPTVNAAPLNCNVEPINGNNLCEMEHDRVSNILHLTHRWFAGPGGNVTPGFTFTGETTIFRCTCNTHRFVGVGVAFTILGIVENQDDAIISCPPVNVANFPV